MKDRVLGALVAVMLGIPLLVFFVTGVRGDTDPPDGRSGMWLRTDAGTGCQYLEGTNGGLTPRRDVQGNHMGCVR